MKKIIIILISLAFSTSLFAQDTIYLRRGKNVIVKVIEIGPKAISFQKLNDPDPDVYRIDMNYIDSIVYKSGRVEKFNLPRMPLSPAGAHRVYKIAKNRRSFVSGPNSVSSGIYVLDNTGIPDGKNDINNKPIVAHCAAFERVVAKNKIGFSLMPFIGLNRKAYGAGFGMNLYPRPYSQAVFHTGPQLLLYRSEIRHSYFNQEGGYTVSGIYPTTILTFIYNVGVNIHVNKNWMIGTDFGFGHGLINTKRKELDRLRGYGDRHGYIFSDIMVNGKLGVVYRF